MRHESGMLAGLRSFRGKTPYNAGLGYLTPFGFRTTAFAFHETQVRSAVKNVALSS